MGKFDKALVIGGSGGIGRAMVAVLDSAGTQVTSLHRASVPAIDLTDEQTIEAAADAASEQGPFDLIFVATGALALRDAGPEKGLRQLDPAHLAEIFALNAIGPALICKHFHRHLPREGRSVIAALSARVGSVGDNGLGGWYGYRASKAALNQVMHTAAIEIGRKRPHAITLVLHPGTVDTTLSSAFTEGSSVFTPAESAEKLLQVMAAAAPDMSGGFFDYSGARIPW